MTDKLTKKRLPPRKPQLIQPDLWDDYTLIKMAGMLEFGSIFSSFSRSNLFNGTYFPLYIVLRNRSLPLMQWLNSNFGGYFHDLAKSNGKCVSNSYDWRSNSRQSVYILNKCAPYLLAKRQHANLAIIYGATIRNQLPRGPAGKYHKINPEYLEIRKQVYESLRELNKPGFIEDIRGRKIPDSLIDLSKGLGLFDFIEDIDGFGLSIKTKEEGFFDAFIDGINRPEKIRSRTKTWMFIDE